MRQTKRITAGVLALGLFALAPLAGCGNRGGDNTKKEGAPAGQSAAGQGGAAEEATPVSVATAQQETVTRSIPVTGSVDALQNISLSPKVTARVISVAGREGASVRAGQVVVQQDVTDLNQQLVQAEANLSASQAAVQSNQANLQSAQTKLAQARTNANLQVAQSGAGVRDAQQQVTSAQAQLALARRPQRGEEVRVAQNNVAQAKANYDKAVSDQRRYESLVKEGAAAQITLDQYRTTTEVAKTQLDSANEQLQIAQKGGRTEEVTNAEAALARARTALRLAQANRAQISVRQEDVQAAQSAIAQSQAAIAQGRAQVQQQEAAVRLARQAVVDASIVSPINGVISERLTEPGQQAAPGNPVLRLVSLKTVFFNAQVPETDIRTIQLGQSVTIRIDAYPGKTFNGKVARIYPVAASGTRSFNVRVEIPNTTGALRPGLYARGEVVAERHQGLVVPKDAIVGAGEDTVVYVVENGNKAVQRKVKVGIQTTQKTEITSGVRAGDQVVVNGQGNLRDGMPVTIAKDAAENAQTAER